MMARPGNIETHHADDQLAPVRDHEAPGRGGTGKPGAEEAQRGLEQDDVSHLERGQDDSELTTLGKM